MTFERTGSQLLSILKERLELENNRPKHNKKVVQQAFNYGVYIEESESGALDLKAELANGQKRRLSSFTSLESSQRFIQKILEENKTGSLESSAKINSLITKKEKEYSLQNRDVVLLDRGRELGEKTVFLIRNGMLQGFGYADLNHQINNIPILESIITPMKQSMEATYLIESYLQRHNVKMIELEA